MSELHFVVIKGNMVQAIVAANARGVILQEPSRHPRFSEIRAYTDAPVTELAHWYNADHVAGKTLDQIAAAPVAYAPGALLWYRDLSVADIVAASQHVQPRNVL